MKIITKASLKDFYDRYADVTDNLNVWVREPGQATPMPESLAAIYRDPKFPALPETRILTDKDAQVAEVQKFLPYSVIGPGNEYHDDYGARHKANRPGFFSGVHVFVAGKLYSGVRYTERQSVFEYQKPTIPARYRVYWTAESLTNEFGPPEEKKEKYRLFWRDKARQDWDAYFAIKTDPKIAEWMIDNHTPVLIVGTWGGERESWWIKNATVLGMLQLNKLVDPAQMYQELDMFCGGVLVKPDRIPQMDDKQKVASHGMDKMSFRKSPTKIHT